MPTVKIEASLTKAKNGTILWIQTHHHLANEQLGTLLAKTNIISPWTLGYVISPVTDF